MKTLIKLSLVALIGFFAAPAGADTADAILKDIESSGTLRVCQAADEPWSFINPTTGSWDGLTQEMAASLAEEMGVKLEVVDAGWTALVQNLTSGKCHMSVAAMFATVKRSQVILFTRPFAHEGQIAVVHKDSKITSYEELDQAGKVILAEAGSATTEFAKRFFKNAEIKILSSASKLQMLADVHAGRADASWLAYLANVTFLKANPQLEVRFIGSEPVGHSAIRWAVPAGEYHFQQLVDLWLTQFIRSGRMEAVWNKWFEGAAYVSGGDN